MTLEGRERERGGGYFVCAARIGDSACEKRQQICAEANLIQARSFCVCVREGERERERERVSE